MRTSRPGPRRASYRQNTAAIRKEYSHIPDGVFRKGRDPGAGRPSWKAPVFPHPTGRQRWEAAAQRNLRAGWPRRGLIFSRPLKLKGPFGPCNGARGGTMCPMANEQGRYRFPGDDEAWNLLSGVALGRLVTSSVDSWRSSRSTS